MSREQMKQAIKDMMKSDPAKAEMMKGKDMDAMSDDEMRAMMEKMQGMMKKDMQSIEQEVSVQMQATPTAEGFDILAINAGEAKGHGIIFSDAVLQEAIPHYDSKPVFIDHAGLGSAPSVRDLAGTITLPAWNDRERGIQAKLHPGGPAAGVLLAVRDAAKTNAAIMQAVGFSTVLNVQLDRKGNVTKIVHVKSVDVVIDPARGGKFLSAYQNKGHMKGEYSMDPKETEQAGTTASTAALQTQSQIEANRSAAAELLGEQARLQALETQLAESDAILVAQCEHLLSTGLASSRLPELTQNRIRKQFAGRKFKAVELQEAIKDAQTEVAALQSITGPARAGISGMTPSRDQFRLAVEDLFGMERAPEEKNVKVHKLSGIREAYILATGDNGFMGGFYPEFALVTANFPGIVANVMNKMLLMAWKDFEQHYGWWKKIVTVEHFTNLNDVSWVRTGTIASLPTVAERGEYTELAIGDNKETSTWEKFGGYVPLTIEAVLRDDIRAFKRMPREAALAGIRNISEQVAEIFTQASGAGPTLADTGALFNATAIATAGGHLNLLTTALGTDYTAWNAVAAAVYNQPLLVKNDASNRAAGKKMAIDPSYCLVPRALKNQAEALFVPRWEAQAQNVAAVSPSWGGRVEVLTVPEWTDATNWAAAVDPKLVPGVMLGEIFGVEPQIFSASSEIDPAMFANDESRIKVRQFLTVGVADYRPLHKSNVA